MRIYKGIVCDINKKYMIFMTGDGEFLRGIPLNSNPQIGDEVEFQLITVPFPLKKNVKTYIIGPVIAVAILLFFIGTSLLTNTNSAYAYVQLGEELVLSVDEQGNVISADKLKASSNLSFDDLKGLPIDAALSKAVNKIAPDVPNITISTKYNDEKPSISKENIEKAVNQVQNTKSKKNTDNNTNGQTNSTPNKNNKTNENQSIKNKVENKDTKENNPTDKENNHNYPSTNSNNGNQNKESNSDKGNQQQENTNASKQNNNSNENSHTNNGSKNNKSNDNDNGSNDDKNMKNDN